MPTTSLLRPPSHPLEGTLVPGFSLSPELIRTILRHARPLGQHEDSRGLNLGFGFLYYALVRALRPRHVVVIGSGFGLRVVCLALGFRDNAKGCLSFVDSSYSVLTDGPLRPWAALRRGTIRTKSSGTSRASGWRIC